jgi:hypothetical protein
MWEGLGCEPFGSELRAELLSRTVWMRVITLPLVPSHRGRGNDL